jgi:hypothetical protein
MAEERIRNNGDKSNTTIAIWKSTKEKLDENRAPGQCYNGFICQLIDLWEERIGEERVYRRSGSANEDVNY